jgi:hypothetical protein
MRVSYALLFLFLPLLSCQDEEKVNSSQFIIVNQVNGKGNISLYNYPEDKLTVQHFTLNSAGPSPVYGAIKSGNHIYMHTGFSPLKLRKIDFTTGMQAKEVDSWINSPSFIESYQGNIILSYAEYNFDVDKYLI